MGVKGRTPSELAPRDVVLAYGRRSTVRRECRRPSYDQRLLPHPELCAAVLAFLSNDTGFGEKCVRGGRVRSTPSPCRVRRLDFGAQGRPEHLLLDAHDLGLSGLYPRAEVPPVRTGCFIFCVGAYGQAHDRDAAVRSPIVGFLAAEAAKRRTDFVV